MILSWSIYASGFREFIEGCPLDCMKTLSSLFLFYPNQHVYLGFLFVSHF